MCSVRVYWMCTGNFSDGQPKFSALKMISKYFYISLGIFFCWRHSYVWNLVFLKKSRVIFPCRDTQMLTVTIIMRCEQVKCEKWMRSRAMIILTGWMASVFFSVFAVCVYVCALSCLSAPKNVLREIFRWTFAGRIKRLLQMPADLFTLISHEMFDVHMCNTTHKDLQIIPQNSNTHDRKLTTNLAQLFLSQMHWTQK